MFCALITVRLSVQLDFKDLLRYKKKSPALQTRTTTVASINKSSNARITEYTDTKRSHLCTGACFLCCGNEYIKVLRGQIKEKTKRNSKKVYFCCYFVVVGVIY